MRLFTFGDSWTEGVGGDSNKELEYDTPEERTKIRQEFCWPRYLSEILNVEFINNGIGGASNNIIFETVSHCLKSNQINRGDFIVIMWTSFLRDDVPFFPKGEWHFWGERYKSKKHIYTPIFNKTIENNVIFDRASLSYKEFYLTNLYCDTYYNIINQNYIFYLQHMFNEMGIRYMFCDAFDSLIKNPINQEIDKTNLINRKHYWGFENRTFRDLLIETNRKNVWEDNSHFTESQLGKHPNKNGYKLIAEEIYDFIQKNNLLGYNLKEPYSLLL